MYTNRSNGKQLPWPAAKDTHTHTHVSEAGVFVCAELQFALFSLISQMKLQIKITELALQSLPCIECVDLFFFSSPTCETT